jgi:tetratricopeptide (TPR) repeat protein
MMRRLRVLIVIALAAGVIAVALVFPGTLTRLGDTLALARLPGEKRVAVLPFADASGRPSDQAFCDGLQDVVISGLTRLSETRDRVWVVPVSDIREQRIATVMEARRAVGANLAFSGAVERRGDRVILSLELVDTRTGRALRCQQIDDAMSDLAIFQDGIIVAFARMLGIDAAPRELDPLPAARTDSPVAYAAYLRARGHLQRFVREESVDAAIELLESALEADPDYPSAHAAMGEACWRKCEVTWDTLWIRRATASCERALGLDPDLEEARVTLGLINVGRGRFEDAVIELERALAINPASADAHRELAHAYHGLGDIDRALAMCEKAIELRPTYWAGYNILGRFYYSQGRLEEAATQFLHVIRLAPDNASAHANLGVTYYAMGRLDEACAALERSTAIKPNYRALNNLATIHYQEGQYREAADTYEQALLYDDRDYRVWGNLGSAYRQLGDTELSDARFNRAIEKAERFLAVNQRDPVILMDLAGYFVTQAEYGRVVELLDRALALAPSDVDVLLDAVHIFEITGERERALEVAARAIEHGLRHRIEGVADLDELILDERYKRLVSES